MHLTFLNALGGYHLEEKINKYFDQSSCDLPSVGIYLAAVTRSSESKKLKACMILD